MKRNNLKSLTRIYLILAMVSFGFLTSCYRNEPTLLKLKLIDEQNEIVSNANVHVYGEPTLTPHNEVLLDYDLISDSNGEVFLDLSKYFKPGQAGLAVVNVEVNFNDDIFAESLIKVEQNKLNTADLILMPN